MFKKFISFIIICTLFFQQTGFAQLVAPDPAFMAGAMDRYRPIHLRYLSLETDNSLNVLFDKGSVRQPVEIDQQSPELMRYFLIGLSLPNDAFWVNLRPDAPDNVIDNDLAKTDMGRIMLEADLQLKKDTSRYTSPNTKEGRRYWDKLYTKAGELFGSEDITIPMCSRPWIVPGEIIMGETATGAYIYKAQLKVMLEQDYIKDPAASGSNDPRQKELNAYAAQLVRELVVPAVTRDLNASRKYAALRQVYYSLIFSQWFKQRQASTTSPYSGRIDSRDLQGLTSSSRWSKDTYFNAYRDSFTKGEYNIQETVAGASGMEIRNYVSGGMKLAIPVVSVDSSRLSSAALAVLGKLPDVVAAKFTDGRIVTSMGAGLNFEQRKILSDFLDKSLSRLYTQGPVPVLFTVTDPIACIKALPITNLYFMLHTLDVEAASKVVVLLPQDIRVKLAQEAEKVEGAVLVNPVIRIAPALTASSEEASAAITVTTVFSIAGLVTYMLGHGAMVKLSDYSHLDTPAVINPAVHHMLGNVMNAAVAENDTYVALSGLANPITFSMDANTLRINNEQIDLQTGVYTGTGFTQVIIKPGDEGYARKIADMRWTIAGFHPVDPSDKELLEKMDAELKKHEDGQVVGNVSPEPKSDIIKDIFSYLSYLGSLLDSTDSVNVTGADGLSLELKMNSSTIVTSSGNTSISINRYDGYITNLSGGIDQAGSIKPWDSEYTVLLADMHRFIAEARAVTQDRKQLYSLERMESALRNYDLGFIRERIIGGAHSFSMDASLIEIDNLKFRRTTGAIDYLDMVYITFLNEKGKLVTEQRWVVKSAHPGDMTYRTYHDRMLRAVSESKTVSTPEELQLLALVETGLTQKEQANNATHAVPGTVMLTAQLQANAGAETSLEMKNDIVGDIISFFKFIVDPDMSVKITDADGLPLEVMLNASTIQVSSGSDISVLNRNDGYILAKSESAGADVPVWMSPADPGYKEALIRMQQFVIGTRNTGFNTGLDRRSIEVLTTIDGELRNYDAGYIDNLRISRSNGMDVDVFSMNAYAIEVNDLKLNRVTGAIEYSDQNDSFYYNGRYFATTTTNGAGSVFPKDRAYQGYLAQMLNSVSSAQIRSPLDQQRKSLLLVETELRKYESADALKDGGKKVVADKESVLDALSSPEGKVFNPVISDFASDTDSVASAIAESYRLSKLQGQTLVFPLIQGQLNDETLFVLKAAGIDVNNLIFLEEDDKDVENALAGLRQKNAALAITLVDHSKIKAEGDNLRELQNAVDVVIDHHPINAGIKPKEAVSETIGATATLIYERFVVSGIAVSVPIARILLSAILSDTKNLKVNVTERDTKAAEALKNIAGLSDKAVKKLFSDQTHALNSIRDDYELEKVFNDDNLRYFTGDNDEKYSFTTFRMNYDERDEFDSRFLDFIKEDMESKHLTIAFFNLTYLDKEGGISADPEKLYVFGYWGKIARYMNATGIPYKGKLKEVAVLGDVFVYVLEHKGAAPRKKIVANIKEHFAKADGGSANLRLRIDAQNIIEGTPATVGRPARIDNFMQYSFLGGVIMNHVALRKIWLKDHPDDDGYGFDVMMNKRLHLLYAAAEESNKHVAVTLFLGNVKEKQTLGQQWTEMEKQLWRILDGFTDEQLRSGVLSLAIAPEIAQDTAGVDMKDPAAKAAAIAQIHSQIYWSLRSEFSELIRDEWGGNIKLYAVGVKPKDAYNCMMLRDGAGLWLVHGGLFASAGIKLEGFIDVTREIAKAAKEGNRTLDSYVDFKSFDEKERTPVEEFVPGLESAVTTGQIDQSLVNFIVADQDINLFRWHANLKAQKDGGKKTQAVVDQPADTLGGIDFRGLSVLRTDNPAVSDLLRQMRQVPVSGNSDLNAEWSRIVSAPSSANIKEFVAACYQRGELEARSAKVLACISTIVRDDELESRATDPDLKAMLAVLSM